MGRGLYDHFDRYELLDFGEQIPAGYKFIERRHDRTSFLARFQGDHFSMMSLRSFVGERSYNTSRLTDAEVLRQVAYCLASGEARLVVHRPLPIVGWAPPKPELPIPAPPAEIADYEEVYAIDLTHLYHDDDPVQDAEYELELADGQVVKGRLDKKGKATVKDLKSPPKRVRYGEDQREFHVVDQRKNARYKPPPKALEEVQPITSVAPYRPNPYIVLHDDDPGYVQEYDFIEAERITVDRDAVEVLETFDAQGKPRRPAEISFAVPDVIEAGEWFLPYQEEEQEIVAEVVDWLWGTIQGSFNEKATTSQIVADAAISMIPVVGEITAARDLIAVVRRMVKDPEKRDDILEWIQIVLLLFSVVPVIGGAVKGAGRVLLKMSKGATTSARAAELFLEALAVLDRITWGQAKTFLRSVNVQKHLATILGGFRRVMSALLWAMKKILELGRRIIPDDLVRRVKELQILLVSIAIQGERMIPGALKELHRRLRVIQECLYAGNYHAIGAASAGRVASRLTRVTEATLVSKVSSRGRRSWEWKAQDLPFPNDAVEMFHPLPGFPDLTTGAHVTGSGFEVMYQSIYSFSGPIRPVVLAPGTKLYRIVGPKNDPLGLWWVYELPKSGPEWRQTSAVLDSWNGNGEYVELIVPEGGLVAWEGTIASKIEQDAGTKTFGQFLPGGDTQVMIDFRFPANAHGVAGVSGRKATNWTGTSGIGVPDDITPGEVRFLGYFELRSKLEERARAASGPAKNTAESMNREPQEANP